MVYSPHSERKALQMEVKKNFTIRVTPEMRRQIEDIARRQNMRASDWVRETLGRELKRRAH